MSEGWTEESANSYFEAELRDRRYEQYGRGAEVLNRFSQALENLCKYGFGKATDEGLSED